MDIKGRRASQKVGSQNSGSRWFYLFADFRKTHSHCQWWLYCKIQYWKNNCNQQSDSSLVPTTFQCSWPALPGWELRTERAGWQMGSAEQAGSWQQAQELPGQVVKCGWIKEFLDIEFCCKQAAPGYPVPWSAVRGPAAACGFLELKMSHFKVAGFSFLLLHFLCFLKINKKWEPGNSLERSCSLFVL